MEGGSCNDYDYVCGDPVNAFDLDGQICWRCVGKVAVIAAGMAGVVACGVSVDKVGATGAACAQGATVGAAVATVAGGEVAFPIIAGGAITGCGGAVVTKLADSVDPDLGSFSDAAQTAYAIWRIGRRFI